MLRTYLICALLLPAVFGAVHPWVRKLGGGRIVGGKDTTIEKYPHQISLQFYEAHFCGGSIIDKNTILTAAHCVEDMSINRMTVLAGCTNNEGCSGGQSVPVARIIPHEKWNVGVKYDFDIALIKLKEPLRLNGINMKAIPLASSNDNATTSSGKALVSGWGSLTENGEDPDILQEVELDMISREECQGYFGSVNKITNNMICAKTLNKDTCQGDSGGPLISKGKQIGVVSWGIGCARPKYPGIYTNVIELGDWIRKNM